MTDNPILLVDVEQLLWNTSWEWLSEDDYEYEEDDDITDIQHPHDSPEKSGLASRRCLWGGMS